MNVYGYTRYHDFLLAWMNAQPRNGRGIAQKLSQYLGISTVLMSQIFNGSRTLKADYAFGIAEFIGLNSGEKEYFLNLVHYELAGTHSYREHMRKKIESLRSSASEIKNRVTKDISLTEEAKAKFYSHWHYSAVRLMTDIPGKQTARDISESLSIKIAKVSEILEFLVQNKLCIQESGKFKMAIQNTHLDSDSPWIYSRQLQWRQKSIQSMNEDRKDTIYYTGPMVVSEKDIGWIREKLVQTIKEVTDKARKSSSERLMCLNIDWFNI